jgi:hypothetical protein
VEVTTCKHAQIVPKLENLNIIDLGERRNINNRNTEILITNYETEKSLFD